MCACDRGTLCPRCAQLEADHEADEDRDAYNALRDARADEFERGLDCG